MFTQNEVQLSSVGSDLLPDKQPQRDHVSVDLLVGNSDEISLDIMTNIENKSILIYYS